MSRIGEPIVVCRELGWNGKQFKPGDKLPKDLADSPSARLRWWRRRYIVPTADVVKPAPKAKPTEDEQPKEAA